MTEFVIPSTEDQRNADRAQRAREYAEAAIGAIRTRYKTPPHPRPPKVENPTFPSSVGATRTMPTDAETI